MHLIAVFLLLICSISIQQEKPEWCRKLPRPEYSKLERAPVRDPWFEVYRVRPGVFAIYEPHQSEEVISYLITGSRRALLFDTGMGISNIRKTAEELTSLPVSVLNSHTHNDHVGDNWRFNDIFAMNTAFTRANAKGSLDDAQAEIAPGEICGKLPAGFDAKAYRTKPFNIAHWVRDGETLDLGGRKLQVIATPGHTPDSISLFDRSNGLLFTGDTYYPGPIFLYRPETDLDAYTASLRKMIALGSRVHLLLPAHNVPVADPNDLGRALAAMGKIRSGEVQPVRQGDKWEYRFPGFSFLLKK